MTIKPFLWGPTPNSQLAVSLAKQGFGSVMVPYRQLQIFGGSTLPTVASPGVKAAGLDTYMSLWLTNYWNNKTPLIDWFDAPDQKGHHWSDALTAITAAAKAAKALGCVGLAIDTEMYSSNGGKASWTWDYPGNKQSQDATGAQAHVRGGQVAKAIQSGFPEAKVLVYITGTSMLPGLYLDLLDVKDKIAISSTGLVALPFWYGFAVGSDAESIIFLDSTFYKEGNVKAGPFGGDADHGWKRSLAATTTGFAKLGLSSGTYISPFIWLDGDVANEGTWATPTIPANYKTFRPAVLTATQNNTYAVFQYSKAFNYASFAPVGS